MVTRGVKNKSYICNHVFLLYNATKESFIREEKKRLLMEISNLNNVLCGKKNCRRIVFVFLNFNFKTKAREGQRNVLKAGN